MFVHEHVQDMIQCVMRYWTLLF